MDMFEFQKKCMDWAILAFSDKVVYSKEERNHRFLEESLELVQSLGCTKSEAQQLLDYVFDRPTGEPQQELGGVMNTIAILSCVNDLNMDFAARLELNRINKIEILDKIREKQAKKPKHSPLPIKPRFYVKTVPYDKLKDDGSYEEQNTEVMLFAETKEELIVKLTTAINNDELDTTNNMLILE